jgi:hypothetical protein
MALPLGTPVVVCKTDHLSQNKRLIGRTGKVAGHTADGLNLVRLGWLDRLNGGRPFADDDVAVQLPDRQPRR